MDHPKIKVPVTKRYVLVARVLARTAEYTTTDVLAIEAGMTRKQFVCSISSARRYLLRSGIMIVNKPEHGYKVGTFEEFKKEADKSCRRAFAHLKSMSNQIWTLKYSDKIEDIDGLNEIKAIIEENLESIQVILRGGSGPLKPGFLDDIANEPI